MRGSMRAPARHPPEADASPTRNKKHMPPSAMLLVRWHCCAEPMRLMLSMSAEESRRVRVTWLRAGRRVKAYSAA